MAPIVADFLVLIIKELGKCIAEPIKRQFNYLCCFNDNVRNLENEANKLEEARYELQSKVSTAQNKAEIIVPRVLTWLDEVSEIQNKRPNIDNEIIVGCRYSLSKNVKKMAEAMKELRESGNFDTVSHSPPPAALASITLTSTIEFDSRKHIEEEVMASLRDGETNLVGICGMGGVGKTTMAKTIMHRARKELGFEETVMAIVSQDVDKLKIQDDFAKSLGMTLSGESLSSKAHNLRMRLNAGTRRTLIVIDDVWEKLELEELGIPCNSGCKVLITSRNSHILKTMDVEKLHVVQALSVTEAWELFKSNAGSCIEQENVVALARKVVDECKGLPIALVTVGLALRGMENTISTWTTTLGQLKSSNPSCMPEVLNSVYQPLKLSYNFLESEEEKSLFLLCCLFPEDDDIPLETLAIYRMGLQLYEDIASLERTRDTTSFLVERLKNCFLLLEGCDKNHVKMHDVVRDAAIFIASKEEKRIKCNGCTWISPSTGVIVRGETIFPNLRVLWIDHKSRLRSNIFEGMSELNVLCITYHRLPTTVGVLKNLRTLVLENCDSLESMSVVGKLVKLEILIFHYCYKMESLPVEIGRLSRLRLLEISHCMSLKTIAAGIISNLIELEELVVEGFGEWETRNVEGERKNASLSELEHLSNLTRLEIMINNSGLAAEQLRLSPNLLKFHITIGNKRYFITSWDKTMRLQLPADIYNLGKWVHECVTSVESMHVEGDGSSVLNLQLAQNLRRLKFSRCSTVKKLVTHFHLLQHLRLENLSKLEEIRDVRRNHASNFNKLSYIYISGCHRLRSLFSLSTDSFLQLEELRISECEMMEQVFLWNETNSYIHIPLVFPKLKLIELDNLPSLTRFIKGIKSIEFPQLDEMVIHECPLLEEFFSGGSTESQEVIFRNISKLMVRNINHRLRQSWCPRIPVESLGRLRELRFLGYNNMKSLFSVPMMTTSSCLLQLERLDIESCDMMEQIVSWNEEEENQTIIHIPLVFPKLKLLYLYSLPSLTSFVKGIQVVEFPQLEKISIHDCPHLRGFVPTDDYHADDNDIIHFSCKPHKVKFGTLSKLTVSGGRTLCFQSPMNPFIGLLELHVDGIAGLKSLFSFSMSSCLFQLEELEICECDMMEQVILCNEEEEEENQMDIHITPLIFPKLKLLSLDSLPKLTSLSKGIQFPLPARMHINNCPLLESCASSASPVASPHHPNDDYSIHLFCRPHSKVGFDRLREVKINGREERIRRYWCHQIPMIDLFSRLRKLNVFELHGMESLFPCSIARILQNIKYLGISLCEEMVRVIEDDDDDDVDACGGESEAPIRLFPNLECIYLMILPRLMFFGEWKRTLELPSVFHVEIFECDMMEEFTLGPLYTPNLQTLRIDHFHDFISEDVSSALRLNKIRKEERIASVMLFESEGEGEGEGEEIETIQM